MLIREVLLGCSLIAPHSAFAEPTVLIPLPDVSEHRLHEPHPKETDGETNTDMIAYAHVDVSSPVITGAMIADSAALQAANRAIARWWAATPLGHRLTLPELIKLAFQKYTERDSHPGPFYSSMIGPTGPPPNEPKRGSRLR